MGIDTYPAAPLHGCVADARLWQRTLKELGFDDVPLLCARELEVAGSMPRVVRMLAHVETDLPRAEVTHVYLHGAAHLRRDLVRVREVLD